jgi:ligand-binding sensor domain-containing protein
VPAVEQARAPSVQPEAKRDLPPRHPPAQQSGPESAGSLAPLFPSGPPAPRRQAAPGSAGNLAPLFPSGSPVAPRAAAPSNVVQFDIGQRNVKALLIDGDETWVGTSGGVVRYFTKRDKYVSYDNKSGLLSNGVFYLGRFGSEVWVGTYGGGLSIFDPARDTWRNYNIPNGMADAFVYDVLKTRNGDVWIATWSGANRVLGGRMDNIRDWALYTVENTKGGLPNDWVYGLAEGKNGEIWVATEGGVARFVDEKWTRWTHAQGLGAPFDLVEKDIEYTSDPSKVSGHHARQKIEMGLQNINVAYNPNYVVSMVVDDSGAVWAGTWGGGLSRFDGRQWTTFTMRDGLPGNHVFSLEKGPDGKIWIGTSRGLTVYDGKGFKRFDATGEHGSREVFAIAFGADKAIWIGGFGRLSWYPHTVGSVVPSPATHPR